MLKILCCIKKFVGTILFRVNIILKSIVNKKKKNYKNEAFGNNLKNKYDQVY